MLVFPLSQPGRLKITVFGPGPSCNRLGTFGRRGRAGINHLLFSGRLFGRPLPAGRYAVVVELVRATSRVRIGRVLIQILRSDGREGGSRPLAAPDCSVNDALVASLASVNGLAGALLSAGSSGSAPRSAGVAGVSTPGGEGEDGTGFPGLPDAPQLPPLPNIDSDSVLDQLATPLVLFALLGLLAAAASAVAVAYGVRRYRETWY